MKKLFMIAAAASLVATMANAQTTTVETTTGAAGASVRIEPEYRDDGGLGCVQGEGCVLGQG